MLHLAIILMLQQAAAPTPATEAAAVSLPSAVESGSELLQVRSVYILPMGSSMDQYLANRLTRAGVLQVVTDPSKADAVLTDRIGKPLELKMDELYPDPAKLAAAAAAEAAAAAKQEEAGDGAPMRIRTNAVERSGSFGRGKGTLFLVHRASRNVIWSVYDLPRSTRPYDLDDVAAAAVKNLGAAMEREVKASGAASEVRARRRGLRP